MAGDLPAASCVPLAPSAMPSLRRIQLPFSQSGVVIERSSGHLKVAARLGLVFLWSRDDSLLVRPGQGRGGGQGRKCCGQRWAGRSDPTPQAGEEGALGYTPRDRDSV